MVSGLRVSGVSPAAHPEETLPEGRGPLPESGAGHVPGGVSELDAALPLLHPPDEDLEVGKVRMFVEGAGETPTRPCPTDPVYDGTRPTLPYAVVCDVFPREPTWGPTLQLATHTPRGWANPRLSPPFPGPGVLTTYGRSSGNSTRAPPCSSSPSDPRGPRAGTGGHPHPPLRGSARAPPPPLAAEVRDGVHNFLQTQEVTAVTGVHLVRLPPVSPDNPRGPRALIPTPNWELWCDMWAAWLARLRPQCWWMTTDPCPLGTNSTASSPLRSPPPPRAALHGTAHGTPLMH